MCAKRRRKKKKKEREKQKGKKLLFEIREDKGRRGG